MGRHNHLGIRDGRVPYGHEQELIAAGESPIYLPRNAERCPDCAVVRGELHERGCDVEQCPECRHQLIGCEHDV